MKNITKFTSLKTIINKLFQDSGNSDSININSCAEWCYECLELIGSPLQYLPSFVNKDTNPSYLFTNYRVALPNCFHKLLGVWVDGIHCLPSSNVYQNLLCQLPSTFTSPNQISGEFIDNYGNVFSTDALPLSNFTLSSPYVSTITYDISQSYITFSHQSGDATILYYRFPVDDEGYPLIPDVIEVVRAVSSYLQYKLDYINWRQGIITDKVFQESKDQYHWNITQASNKLKMPQDSNEMESLRRSITRMAISTNEWQSGFKNLNRNNRYV